MFNKMVKSRENIESDYTGFNLLLLFNNWIALGKLFKPFAVYLPLFKIFCMEGGPSTWPASSRNPGCLW